MELLTTEGIQIHMQLSLMYAVAICLFIANTQAQSQADRAKSICNRSGEATLKSLFAEIKDNQNKSRLCEETEQEKYGPRILIANKCEFGADGCPISLPKPDYPDIARKLRKSQEVRVKVIIDESGRVVYSKAITGHKSFWRNAEAAACKAIFRSKRICGIASKAELIIVYNFVNP